IGVRSFADWKFRSPIGGGGGGLFVTGGFEMNYFPAYKNAVPISPLGGGGAAWQRSALLGVTKKIAIKTKWAKATNIQLLYDFLSRQHEPFSQRVLFRVGYSF